MLPTFYSESADSSIMISEVPTNIITGFLGVGKTTALLHLLRHKPSDESWAVLVNEFGEVGVDGSLFQGAHSEAGGVFVREVPGGCMCCASGLPMQMALNQLLTRAQPDRLLIEPTGLGHPREVLQALTADHYHGVLKIQRTLTLVDARKLADVRYTQHETFNQQIDIADIIVGNKQDLYQEEDFTRLQAYLPARGHPNKLFFFSSHGKLDLKVLEGPSQYATTPQTVRELHAHQPLLVAGEQPLPECGYLAMSNEGEGFVSRGWRFASHLVFDRSALFHRLSGLKAERMKAIFITTEGIFGYNLTSDALIEVELDDSLESRIEIIDEGVNPIEESDLLGCLSR